MSFFSCGCGGTTTPSRVNLEPAPQRGSSSSTATSTSSASAITTVATQAIQSSAIPSPSMSSVSVNSVVSASSTATTVTRSTEVNPIVTTLLNAFGKTTPPSDQEKVVLYEQMNTLSGEEISAPAAFIEPYSEMIDFFSRKIVSTSLQVEDHPSIIRFLYRELNHTNYPFNFGNYDPQALLLSFMDKITALEQNDRLLWLWEQAMGAILDKVFSGSSFSSADLAKLLKIPYLYLSYLNTHSQATPKASILIQLHITLQKLVGLLESYSNLTEVASRVKTEIINLEKRLGYRNESGTIITSSTGVLEQELTTLNNTLLTRGPSSEIAQTIKGIYSRLLLMSNSDSLKRKLSTLLRNYNNKNNILEIQKACIQKMNHLKRTQLSSKDAINACRIELENICAIARQSYGNSFFGLPRSTQEKCMTVGDAMESCNLYLDTQTFQLTYGRNTFSVAAERCQFNLPAINMMGKLEVPRIHERHEGMSPSKSSCASNALWALYFDMVKNLNNDQKWTDASNNLPTIIRMGIHRYQEISKEIAEKQVLTISELKKANDSNRPLRLAAAKEVFLDAGYSETFLAQYIETERTKSTPTTKEEFIARLDRIRPHLSYKLALSGRGFSGLLERPSISNDTEGEEGIRWKMQLSQGQEETLYQEFLNRLTELVPNSSSSSVNQMGALMQRGAFFFAVTMVRTQSGYAVTITDSHGSENQAHRQHYNKAFKITFSSIADAASFLAVHYPTQGDNLGVNQCTLYPLTLSSANTGGQAKLNADFAYNTSVLGAMQRTRSSSVSTSSLKQQVKKP